MREAISMHSAHLRLQSIKHRRAITPMRKLPCLILASTALVGHALYRALHCSLMPLLLQRELRRARLGVGHARLLAHRLHSGLGDAHTSLESPPRLGRLLMREVISMQSDSIRLMG